MSANASPLMNRSAARLIKSCVAATILGDAGRRREGTTLRMTTLRSWLLCSVAIAACAGGGAAVKNPTGPTTSTTNRTFSMLASGGGGFNAVGFTCGLTTGGAAYCWGSNENSELGDGTTTNRLVPTRVNP